MLICLSVQAKDPPKKYLDNDYSFKPEQFIKWLEKTGVWGKNFNILGNWKVPY